jgi:hypothetical protein
MQSDNHYLAAGWDNEIGLTRWHKMSTPLFANYVRGFSIKWKDSDRYEMNAARMMQATGKPVVEYQLGLSEREYQYLRSTFASSTRTGKVTIRTYNGVSWANYNAVLELPEDPELKDGFYAELTITFRDLHATTSP